MLDFSIIEDGKDISIIEYDSPTGCSKSENKPENLCPLGEDTLGFSEIFLFTSW